MRGKIRDLIGRVLLPLIQGSSSVVIENEHITKYNHPTVFVRLLHLIFFRRWIHPYEIKDYLYMATYRRRIANLVLEFTLNKKDTVAIIDAVGSEDENNCGIRSRFIKGELATPSPEARKFFETVVEAFLKAGLPTWQVNPRFNPRAWTNAICQNGSLVIIDLESQVPNLFVPFAEWRTAWKNGHLFPFDEMDFDKLWAYVRVVEEKGWPKAPCLRNEARNAWFTFKHLKGTKQW